MGWTQYTLAVFPQFSQSWRDAHVFFGDLLGLPGANDEDRPRHRWWGTLVQHGSCGAQNPKDSLHPGSARNKADWRPMLELPPVTAAYYCCNFGHIVLGHSGKRVPWFFFERHSSTIFATKKFQFPYPAWHSKSVSFKHSNKETNMQLIYTYIYSPIQLIPALGDLGVQLLP